MQYVVSYPGAGFSQPAKTFIEAKKSIKIENFNFIDISPKFFKKGKSLYKYDNVQTTPISIFF